jgi:hypothetical protein
MILKDVLHTQAAPLLNTIKLLQHEGVNVCFTGLYL